MDGMQEHAIFPDFFCGAKRPMRFCEKDILFFDIISHPFLFKFNAGEDAVQYSAIQFSGNVLGVEWAPIIQGPLFKSDLI